MLRYSIIILAILAFWQFLWKTRWKKGLTAQMSFPEGTVYAGTSAELVEVVANRKHLPVPELEVGFRIHKGVEFPGADNIVISDYVYKRDVFSLRPMEAVTRRYTLACHRRGRYRISQISLKAWSFFHGYEFEATKADSGEELTVYARRIDVSALAGACDAILGTLESERSLYEDPFAFASIREYTPTDPMKTINWKATARTGNLMVNTYASVRTRRFFVFLDVSDDGILRAEDLVETGISAAASIIQLLIHQGQETGLAVNARIPAVFEPKRGSEQLTRIEHFLTEDFFAEGTSDFRELTSLAAGKKDWICVYISKDLDREGSSRVVRRPAGSLPSLLAIPVRDGGGVRLKVQRLVR